MGRILLVDDDGDGRLAVAEAIRRLTSHVVDEADGGAAALERVRSVDYDLVLLDLRMPGMDGFEVCRRLRADVRTRDVPVLILTEVTLDPERRAEGLEVGADDCIVRPLGNRELVARIKSALRAKTASDEARSRNVQLADELRAERDTLRETLDLFDEALMLVDDGGQVLMANSAARRLATTALGGELKALAADVGARAAPSARPLSDGGRTFLARGSPVSGRRVLLAVRDVTEERDRELMRLQAEKLASIGMLAAGVAHEINNPAAFVLGNFESLSTYVRQIEDWLRVHIEPGARAKGQELLFETKAIIQESKEGMARILGIVRDLSSFSHTDDDDRSATTDLNATVESTLVMLRNEVRHRATLERDLGATRAARGSPARLAQVFLNLVINAAQAFHEPNPRRNRITVRTYDAASAEGDGAVVFEVSDNGPGIAPEVLPRIFDSFFTTKPRGVGTGLGLPISQGIVRALGGDLVVDSQLGRGTTFRVRLPVAPSVAAVAAAGDGAAVAPSASLTASPSDDASTTPGYPRRQVLAIDDEALLLKAYRRMLVEPHDVLTALGGRDALRILERRQDFDVILCDLQMPEMSGMELYAIVRGRLPELAERFIFVTGGAFSSDAKRFLEQEVTRINKPFRVEELLEIIEKKAAASAVPPAAPEAAAEEPSRRYRARSRDGDAEARSAGAGDEAAPPKRLD